MEVEKELDGKYASTEYVQRVLGVDGEQTDAGVNLNSKYMSNTVQRVVGYKVLDLFDWVTSGGHPQLQDPIFPTRYLHTIPTLDTLVCIVL